MASVEGRDLRTRLSRHLTKNMKQLKILMVEPRSPGANVFSRYKLPRLGLPILGTLAARRGHNVSILFEELTPVTSDLLTSADLVCISATTSTAPAAFEISYKARVAGIPVILGGPHPTFMPEEGLRFADWVMRGEAERGFLDFLEVFGGYRNPEHVAGLSYRKDGQIIHNPLEDTPIDLDRDVPRPNFSLLRGRPLNGFHRGIIPMETSRGCPHHCHFCSVTPMFGRRVRFRSIERVAEDLESMRGMGHHLFFYDDNFCASTERTKKLLDHLLTRGVFLPPWLAQVSVSAAKDEELLRLMQRSGCYRLFVGFESINPASLALYHKQQGVRDIKEAIRRFRQHGIRVHGMFITGSDAEDAGSIRAAAKFATDEGIDTVQFLVLTPLPGTPVFDEMDRQGRILTRDWSFYDAHHAVFQPARMSALELMDATFSAHETFYSGRRILSLLSRGEIQEGIVNAYAAAQVRRCRWQNRSFAQLTKNAPTGSMWLQPALHPG